MKRIKIGNFACLLIIIFLVGCAGIPEYNYVGMTRQEVAEHLEKHAFRARWKRNRFEIQTPKMNRHFFADAQEVLKNQKVMSSDEWQCGFYPQRHWLLGWNGLFASWHLYALKFKDGKVVKQWRMWNYYWVYGYAGVSPYPQFPKNFHQVNKEIYRSGQPDQDEFESLYTFNEIRSVLNLRENNSDQEAVAKISKMWGEPSVKLYEIPLDTGKITEEDLYKILTVIRDAPKPLLIHCWHGSDRTGCAVAASRIVFENWTVEDAIAELMKPEYGHHKRIYTNIPELLRNADWKKIKAEILKKRK